MNVALPKAKCQYGYPMGQLAEMLGEDMPNFMDWFHGQTGTICDGTRYDHDGGCYVATGCGPHGMVVYKWDLERYLSGAPVID